MQSGDNAQALQKILDFTRLGSVFLLLIHFYAVCHPAFRQWGLTIAFADGFIYNLTKAVSFLGETFSAKLAALLLLVISLLGSKGRKDEKVVVRSIVVYLLAGLTLYFSSSLLLSLKADDVTLACLYMVVTCVGYLAVLAGGVKVSRLVQVRFKGDVFNEKNETFPQEERLLQNEYSVNLPAQYCLNGKMKKSWINIINPFRAFLVLGTPGAGKSYFVIRHVITQHIQKGFTFFIYDFKFPDLTRIAYNTLRQHYKSYQIPPKLYIINFDDLSRSHRCNPLSPETMFDITDATESSRTIMLALNRDWIKKQGDFFVESPINFITAIFWYLKKYENGKFCTLPHSIELAQVSYEKLFPVLSLEREIEVLVNPFISAYLNGALEQLEGQIASAKICLARLSSPALYYILSGSDFTLDVNNAEHPKLVCAGNNPAKQQTYGAVLSLYIERMLKLVNRKGQLKSSLVFDEFPTVYVNGVDNLIATARSNKVATTLGVQDFSQLRKDYGKEQAEVIMNVSGNIIAGQVIGDTAKTLSERIGKIMQERESISVNANDTSVSRSMQLDAAIPASKISNLSSGEFVGAVADDPLQKIKLKAFHCEILNNHAAIKKEEDAYEELPVIRNIDQKLISQNYYQIKKDIKGLIDREMEKIAATPDLQHLADDKKGKPKKSSVSM
ncbi:MAG: conjugal transfer protein MobC [Chitinophagaceae bacterium]